MSSGNGVRPRHAAGGESDPFASLRENGGGAPADRLAPPFASSSGGHNAAHHASIRQLPHLDEEFPPSDESVETQFDKLRSKVTARRAESNWLLYLGIAVQLATLLWCMYIVSSVDKDKACKRPIRGILTGVGVVLMIALLMTVLTFWHITVAFRRFTSRASDVLREEHDQDPSTSEAFDAERVTLTHQQTEMVVSRSLTDRMMYGCCSGCFLLLSTLTLFALLVSLAMYTSISAQDCASTTPHLLQASKIFSLGVLGVFVMHLAVFAKLSGDFTLCWEIHFLEQSLVKEEVKIRE